MRFAFLLLALLLLAGCSHPTSSGTPSTSVSTPASGPVVSATKAQLPAPSKPATTKPSIEDQPVRTPAFETKEKHQLGPNGMLWLISNRPSKHSLTVNVKATHVTAKVGVSVMLKQDFDNSKVMDKSDIDPKAILGSNVGEGTAEVAGLKMPAVLPYVILLRNYGNEMVNVELAMKAQ